MQRGREDRGNSVVFGTGTGHGGTRRWLGLGVRRGRGKGRGGFQASRIEWYRFEGGGMRRKIGAWTLNHPVLEPDRDEVIGICIELDPCKTRPSEARRPRHAR